MSRYKHYRADRYRVGIWLTRAAMVVAILILGMLGGCAKPPQVAVEVAPGQYQIPVQHDSIDVPAGWEDSRAVMEITVPPSDKPTTVFVRPKSRNIIKKIFPAKNETTMEMVSNNKGAKATQESKIPWWWWAGGGTLGLGAIWIFARQYLGFLPKLAGAAGSLIARLFRK